MFLQMIKDEIARKRISQREAARQIGIAHTTLVLILKGRPSDLKTIELTCKWLGLPLSSVVCKDHDPLYGAVTKVLNETPELAEAFRRVAGKVEGAVLQMDDFRAIVDYALYLVYRRQGIIGGEPIEL